MQSNSRTYNAISNSIYGITASIITVFLNFVVRLVLVKTLGEEINGINSLFQSTISVMTLMELGISSAMIIHLYEPVKLKDNHAIAAIMGFYRRIYIWVACFFGTVGLLVSIFMLDKMVTSSIPLFTVRIYFIIFLSAFVINYLTYYKRSLIYAEQKNRINASVSAACEIVFRGLQILTLLLLHNYFIFLILLAIEKLSGNIICQNYVDKKYPFLRHNRVAIQKEKRIAIFNTIKPLMVNQTANVVQNASASIIIGILLGNVSIVGYYGVYQMVIGVVQLIFSQLGGAFTTSFGNLAVDGSNSAMETAYKNTMFVFNILACICGAVFIACVDDFVLLFFGSNFVLSPLNVALLALSMLIYLLSIPVISIQNAMGLHRYDAMAMVVQAFVAVFLGYIFGNLWDMPGILFGILLPMVYFTLFRKGIIIVKIAFNMGPGLFVKNLFGYGILVFMVLGAVYLTTLFLDIEPSIVSIIVKLIISLLISVVTIFLFSCKKQEYAWATQLFRSGLKKIRNNGR